MAGSYDVIVIGLGGMGSAAARALAARGARVGGFERFGPAHAFGASHGGSRIIRLSYFEHPSYVPLLRTAYDRWERLERDSGRQLLTRSGGLFITSTWPGTTARTCISTARSSRGRRTAPAWWSVRPPARTGPTAWCWRRAPGRRIC